MNTTFPHSLISPTLFSTILYFVSGFCVLLVLFLVIIAFSVIISLTIVSIVHVFSEALHRHSRDDVEAGDRDPRLSRDIRQTPGEHPHDEARGVHSNRQIIEMLDRIIRNLSERRRGSSVEQHERLQKALERLPPRVCYGSHGTTFDCSVKECVICLEDFEAEDLCQAFPICNHVFHSGCIENWMKKNPSCPLCRTCILERGCEKMNGM